MVKTISFKISACYTAGMFVWFSNSKVVYMYFLISTMWKSWLTSVIGKSGSPIMLATSKAVQPFFSWMLTLAPESISNLATAICLKWSKKMMLSLKWKLTLTLSHIYHNYLLEKTIRYNYILFVFIQGGGRGTSLRAVLIYM